MIAAAPRAATVSLAGVEGTVDYDAGNLLRQGIWSSSPGSIAATESVRSSVYE